jgi:hypothetical protein
MTDPVPTTYPVAIATNEKLIADLRARGLIVVCPNDADVVERIAAVFGEGVDAHVYQTHRKNDERGRIQNGPGCTCGWVDWNSAPSWRTTWHQHVARAVLAALADGTPA